jgi:glutamate synthase (ferredoxin)
MLAQLGYEKLDDIIGRTDLLRPRDISLMKTQHLDLSYIVSVRIYLFNYLLSYHV